MIIVSTELVYHFLPQIARGQEFPPLPPQIGAVGANCVRPRRGGGNHIVGTGVLTCPWADVGIRPGDASGRGSIPSREMALYLREGAEALPYELAFNLPFVLYLLTFSCQSAKLN